MRSAAPNKSGTRYAGNKLFERALDRKYDEINYLNVLWIESMMILIPAGLIQPLGGQSPHLSSLIA